jgi:hypothetical protein
MGNRMQCSAADAERAGRSLVTAMQPPLLFIYRTLSRSVGTVTTTACTGR